VSWVLKNAPPWGKKKQDREIQSGERGVLREDTGKWLTKVGKLKLSRIWEESPPRRNGT